MDLYEICVWITRLVPVVLGLGAAKAWYQRKRGPSFKPPASYSHETLLTKQELAVAIGGLRSPLVNTRRINISRLIPSLTSVAKRMSHSDLAHAIEMAEWDETLHVGVARDVATLKLGVMRRELRERVAREAAARLDPHPLPIAEAI